MKPNRHAIRALRKERRWSLRDIEQQTGISRGYLSRLERGYRGASPTTLQVIADALGVAPQDITKED